MHQTFGSHAHPHRTPTPTPAHVRQFGSAAGGVAEEEKGQVGANLWGAESPFAAVLREEDTEGGVFVPRRGFEVVVCTHLGATDFAELLEGKLPMTRLQPIAAVSTE